MIDKKIRLNAIERQVRRLDARIEKLESKSSRFSRTRVLVFISGIGAGILIYYVSAALAGWIVMGLTIAVFNVIAMFHRRTDRSLATHRIWRELKTQQLARMQLDWDLIPKLVPQETSEDHPFGIDLDITGERSLHRLVDSAISMAGSDLLRDWFLTPDLSGPAIRRRQEVVRELTPLARFRDKLFLAFRQVSLNNLDSRRLLHFLSAANLPGSFSKVLVGSFALAAANAVLFGLHFIERLPAYWIFGLIIYAVVYLLNQGETDKLLGESVFISEELKKSMAALSYLQNYKYGDHGHLRELCRPFWEPGDQPSQQLRGITALGTAIGLRMNPIFRLALNIAVPWDFFLVLLMDRYRQRLYPKLDRWLAALTELEALNSLANFAYLNPDSVLPTIVDDGDEDLVLQAKALGHPLLPASARKCNDFTFAQFGDVAVITGSNMSGKSTFLKTLGVNLCLAFAGGPVIAAKMQTRLLRLYTCIKINDSVTDGFSFFYAEVRRLKRLLQELQAESDQPVLFLIDEIFKGTNNRERLIGSRAYIKALVGQNGTGAISTHDLELTNLSDTIPQVSNFHFREEVENGKMIFDYKMRPGPCPSTNALKIMEIEGLPID